MALQINNQKPETGKENRGKKMNISKWDDKFFDESLTYIWVYSKGLLVSTNNRKSRSFILKGFRRNKIKNLNDTPAVKYLNAGNK